MLKRIISTAVAIFLVLSMSVSAFAEEIANFSFTDLVNYEWATPAIMEMAKQGILKGTYLDENGVGTFSPAATMTRAEFITMISRILYNEDLKGVPDGEPWWVTYYETSATNGLFNASEFSVDEACMTKGISRQEMAMLMVRAAGKRGEDTSVKFDSSKIPDFASVNPYFQSYVQKSYNLRLICGIDSIGTFNPSGVLTRAEAATVAYRLLDASTRPELPKVANQDILIQEGKYAGYLDPDVATEYDLAALKTAKFYREGGKMYVSIDLPALPTGFKWALCLNAETADGSCVFYTLNDDWIGVTGHQVIEVYSKYADETINDIDLGTLDICVRNAENKYSISHKLSTHAQGQVYQYSPLASSQTKWINFDTTGIFNW